MTRDVYAVLFCTSATVQNISYSVLKQNVVLSFWQSFSNKSITLGIQYYLTWVNIALLADTVHYRLHEENTNL
jgi:hypothetical protein